MGLTAKEIYLAMEDLGGTVDVRLVGDEWLVSARNIEIKDGGILRSLLGRSTSVEYALFDLWHNATNLNAHEYLVVNAYQFGRRAYKWSGFMWKQVDENV